MSHSPFKNKTYTKLFLAQVISLVGTGITTIALALLAYELAKDRAGEVLGIALALKMVAYVFFSPLIGTFVHKVSRKFWLIFLDLFRALIILYLPFVTTVTEIYILIFLINLGSSGFTPIFQGTISDIIKDEKAYHKALSYSRLAYDLEQLLSPTFSAFLLSFMTFHQLFVLDSVTFLISGLLLFFSSLPKRKKVFENSNFIENLVFGTKAYFKTPRLKALFFIYIVVALASAMVITNTVIYVGEYLKKGEAFVAIAMATTGFGSMIVALVLPKWLEHIEVRKVLFIGSFLIIIGLLLASFTPSWEGFLFVWFILGVGLSLIQVLAGYLVRISCNENNSMSYFSANFSLSHLCWMVAYPLSGFLGTTYGLETALLIFAILAILFSLIAYKIYPNPDEQELEHIHESYQHSHHILDDDHHGDGFEKKHTHEKIVHKHKFVIDYHHKEWPT